MVSRIPSLRVLTVWTRTIVSKHRRKRETAERWKGSGYKIPGSNCNGRNVSEAGNLPLQPQATRCAWESGLPARLRPGRLAATSQWWLQTPTLQHRGRNAFLRLHFQKGNSCMPIREGRYYPWCYLRFNWNSSVFCSILKWEINITKIFKSSRKIQVCESIFQVRFKIHLYVSPLLQPW